MFWCADDAAVPVPVDAVAVRRRGGERADDGDTVLN